MSEKIVNGFMKGMSTDMHYSLLDNQQYLYAENIRPTSSGFSTTGAIENIKGNKFIGDFATTNTTSLIDGHTYMVATGPVTYNGVLQSLYSTFVCSSLNGLTFVGEGRVIDITSYGISEDMTIIGGVELRDSIILFTTNNTRSQIYKLNLTGASYGYILSLDILYDDEYNTDGSRLEFNVNNRIKAVSRYETPNIQKVYWTDGLNPLRYININKNCTIDGETFVVSGDYWGIDKFELLPKVVLSKPTITGITTGTIPTGMVFYAYQLYIENGAESAISYISNPLHVTSNSDYYSNDLYYEGDGVDAVNSKGFIVNIDLSNNDTFDRLKLIRIHYGSYNQLPTIYVASDISINLNNSSVTITDTGSIVTELTVEEFGIDSTEIFICQELATKNNILFAANIEKKTFTIDDFDARAVRFRSSSEPPADTVTISKGVHYDMPIPPDTDPYLIVEYWGESAVGITINNFQEWAGIPSHRVITAITDLLANRISISYEIGGHEYSTTSNSITNLLVSWDGTNLQFIVISTDILFGHGFDPGVDTFLSCRLTNSTIGAPTFEYSYTSALASVTLAEPYDITHGYGTNYIVPPIDNTSLASWQAAGWFSYYEDHDGINDYNNPDNDPDPEKQFIYKSDGVTLGAEGPNIEIEFKWEDFAIDDISGTASTYHVGTVSNGSYSNYSSPLNGGKLSWQRDEVYRLFVSFKNTRGQDTEPKWICDLRIPKMVDSIYGVIANRIFSMTQARRVYPVIKIRDGSWPTDAVSAQVYRVPRNREDRQVVTQCLAYPLTDITGWYMDRAINPIDTYSSNENLVKLLSPEINITKNISKSGNDYLEYLTHFNDDKITAGGYTSIDTRSIIKCRANTVRSSFAADDYTDITDMVSVIPIEGDPSAYSVGGVSFYNYNDVNDIDAKGSSGIVVKYANNSWSAEGKTLALVNYKNNCWNSQYGGLTYENRQFNNMIPCSDIIYDEGIQYNCSYGDTFITYFDVSTLLYDLSRAEGNTRGDSCSEAVYFPVESSINCNLRANEFQMHKQYNVTYSYLIQEELGAHMFTDSFSNIRVYNQTDDMYKYNTVYSQQPLVAALISIDESRQTETVFDTQVRASNVKINGEYVDSWTKFGVNETIDVDSKYGSLNAMLEYGQSLYFWQDEAFGSLSVNDRSLIQDNNASKLVLGTGGVLDRFDYISTQKGCEDKFSVVAGVSGMYWFDRRNKSINRFAESLTDLALQKGVRSLFTLNEPLVRWSTCLGVHDKDNGEVLFTLANYEDGLLVDKDSITDITRPFTLCFNETTDVFTSIYSFIPYIYIPYKNTYLTNSTYTDWIFENPGNLLYIHNVVEDIQARNNFYGLYYNDEAGRHSSKVRLVFNPYYLNTKVFDNVFINGDVKIDTSTADLYYKDKNELIDNELCPINNIKFYNSYQTTENTDLVYKSNLERRERIWTSIIPRNAIRTDYDDQLNNPIVDTITPARTDYQERMRDKYLICEFDTVTPSSNTQSYRTIIENLGVVYRNSYR